MRDSVVRRAHASSEADSARMADLSNRVELSYPGLIFGSDEPLLLQSSKNHALPPRTVSSEGSTGIFDSDERSCELKPRESMARTISACAVDCTKTRASSTELSSSAFNLTGEDELDSFVGLCFANALKDVLMALMQRIQAVENAQIYRQRVTIQARESSRELELRQRFKRVAFSSGFLEQNR